MVWELIATGLALNEMSKVESKNNIEENEEELTPRQNFFNSLTWYLVLIHLIGLFVYVIYNS